MAHVSLRPSAVPGKSSHADRRALLDSTRQITPEELAELQLEQGYVERALRIYEELARQHPDNATYATRRAWLARMSAARPARPEARAVPPRRRVRTLPGPHVDESPTVSPPATVRELRIVRVR